jgi:hypothetical protein
MFFLENGVITVVVLASDSFSVRIVGIEFVLSLDFVWIDWTLLWSLR